MAELAEQTPEARLYGAGFTRRLEWWVSPDGQRVLNMDDAIAGLDSGDIKPGGATIAVPDTNVRALADELVDRICPPAQPKETPPPPRWLLAQAEVIAAATVEKMKPVVRAEVRAALRAEARRRAREPAA
ncbi:MAG TPA: hypothetical protein VES36_01765 [Candidatus Limnocylindrales bacterium]|nr:hypothetical protein [Candidatus Limnocylindrales bacterium]